MFREELDRINRILVSRLEADAFPGLVQPAELRAAVLAYPLRRGKRLRPALTLWFCGLCGGDPDTAIGTALAVELYHNWTLVHDDIIDRDDMRRGEPSCHRLLADAAGSFAPDAGAAAEYGTDLAILAGDIQHGWAMTVLLAAREEGVAPEVAAALAQRLAGWVTPLLISGEALDVKYVHLQGLRADEIEDMLHLKTGVLLRFAAEAGAMIAHRDAAGLHPHVRAASRFAAAAGLAFQLKDDLLGMFGDEGELGKPVGSDLREGKRTVLLGVALECASPAARARLAALCGQPGLTVAEVTEAAGIMDACGARSRLEQRVKSLAAEAAEILAEFPENRYRSLLAQWADYLVNRTS